MGKITKSITLDLSDELLINKLGREFNLSHFVRQALRTLIKETDQNFEDLKNEVSELDQLKAIKELKIKELEKNKRDKEAEERKARIKELKSRRWGF